jgi:hypothetical protein
MELQNSKDGMEGLSNLVVSTPKRLFCTSLVSGYNFGIFCGTSRLDKRREMSDRFGPRIIKIPNLRDFAEQVRQMLGAQRVYANHVRYNDLKMFRVKTVRSFNVGNQNAPNGNFDPQMINDSLFDFLYERSFLSSLFMKPTRFSIEQELRLVFEMPKDVPDVLRISNQGLLKHVEVIQ